MNISSQVAERSLVVKRLQRSRKWNSFAILKLLGLENVQKLKKHCFIACSCVEKFKKSWEEATVPDFTGQLLMSNC